MDKIVLGSGKVYIQEFTGTIPESNVIETESNLLGLISGGASLSYNVDFYECKDDMGIKTKKFITNEDAVFKTGVMTWNGKTLEKLVSTARVTEASQKRTVKIGGASNYYNQNYVIRFVHKDAQDGDIRLTIVGANSAGLELVFAKDKETVINAEFKAIAHDGSGTLISYEEEILG